MELKSITFETEKQLRTYIRDCQNGCATPMEFEKWLEEHADKLYVRDLKEPYSASELAELV